MNVVIILPTYNERENISTLIEKILTEARGISKKYTVELLIVDDHSPDGTGEVVRRLSRKHPEVKLLSGEKKGLGMAYIRGMNYAVSHMQADILFEMDADGQHDPSLIPLFLKQIESGSDFVIGSRYIAGGSIPKEWALKRKIYSVVGNLVVRLGLMIPSIHDWTSGYRALKSKVFNRVGSGLSKFPGYTFQVAFLHRVHQHHFAIGEIPLKFIDRSFGKSKIIPPEYIFNVIRYVLFHSSFIKFGVVGIVGFLIQIIVAHFLILLHLFPGVAVVIGAELALISNFTLNNLWTFSHKPLKGTGKIFQRFFIFNLTSAGSIIIQGVIVTIGVFLFGKPSWLVFNILSIVCIVVPYSYLIYNRFIWKKPHAALT